MGATQVVDVAPKAKPPAKATQVLDVAASAKAPARSANKATEVLDVAASTKPPARSANKVAKPVEDLDAVTSLDDDAPKAAARKRRKVDTPAVQAVTAPPTAKPRDSVIIL